MSSSIFMVIEGCSENRFLVSAFVFKIIFRSCFGMNVKVKFIMQLKITIHALITF